MAFSSIRFGKTLFFEQPLTNPFGHEERFLLSLDDPELRLVTAFDEWLHLRQHTRPCVGDLGSEPVEAEMFDRDGYGNVQVALLPHETLHLPFTFMTLSLFSPTVKKTSWRGRNRMISTRGGGGATRSVSGRGEGKSDSRFDREDSKQNNGLYGEGDEDQDDDEDDDENSRTAEVRVVSCTHGHVVAVIRVNICPRPPVIHRTLRFFESENGLMRRRIQLKTNSGSGSSSYPGALTSASKFVHCVEMENNSTINNEIPNSKPQSQNRVVVEWGPSGSNGSSSGALDILLRYRCGAFPSTGSFFLLVYDDPYQSQLHQVSEQPTLSCPASIRLLSFLFQVTNITSLPPSLYSSLPPSLIFFY